MTLEKPQGENEPGKVISEFVLTNKDRENVQRILGGYISNQYLTRRNRGVPCDKEALAEAVAHQVATIAHTKSQSVLEACMYVEEQLQNRMVEDIELELVLLEEKIASMSSGESENLGRRYKSGRSLNR